MARAVGSAVLTITDALGHEIVATTDRNGIYHATGLATGATMVDLTAAGLIPVNDAAVTLVPGEPGTLDLKLSSGGLVRGRIVNPRGAPVSGAHLAARLVGGDFTQTIDTGFDGRYRLAGLLPGTYELVATATGFGAAVLGSVLIGANATTPLADLALTVGGRVFGTVTDLATGQPIAGAKFSSTIFGAQDNPILAGATGAPLADRTVNLISGGIVVDTATTDSAGRYRFLVFQPGTVDVIASGGEFGFASQLGIAVGTGTVNVPALVPGAASLAVDVHSGAAGQPALNEAFVAVRRVGAPAFGGLSLFAFTHADGSTVIPGLAPGDYEVIVSADGFAASHQTITVGASAAQGSFVLGAGRVVEGTVRGPSGQPLGSALMLISYPSSWGVAPCLNFGPALQAGGGGIFRFSSVHAAQKSVAGRSGAHFCALVSGSR